MYSALVKNPNETCAGMWYAVQPTLANRAEGKFFEFELLADETNENVHLVENLKGEEERMSISTSWRYPFSAEQYVTAFGEMYKIERIGKSRSYPRGIAVPRVTTVLYLVRCASNPLGL